VNAPRTITLGERKPAVTKDVKVTIVNQGSDTETIDVVEIMNLISLAWTSLPGPSPMCPSPTTQLKPPKKGFPVVLPPRKKLLLSYAVTWNCVNDAAKNSKTASHADFALEVSVDHSVLGGGADADPSDDVCPRPPTATDKGCGRQTSSGPGGPIETDLVEK
jgi:hypothetical protein